MCNQPMDVLPSKVLSLIFLWGLPNSKYRFKVDRYRRSISQVCSSWRTICLNTPLLWRTVYIIINHRVLSRHSWSIMGLLIRRARMVPLDLTIDISCGRDPSPVLRLLSLKPHIARLRELHLTSSWLDPIREFFPLGRSMPYLKTLHIHLIGGRTDFPKPLKLWDCDSSFPALESFTINISGSIKVIFSLQSISCDQVSDLNIDVDVLKDREHMKYIKSFKHLRSLGLKLYSVEEVLKYLPPSTHGSLHSLKLSSSRLVWSRPRIIGDTSLVRHLELMMYNESPLEIFKSKD